VPRRRPERDELRQSLDEPAIRENLHGERHAARGGLSEQLEQRFTSDVRDVVSPLARHRAPLLSEFTNLCGAAWLRADRIKARRAVIQAAPVLT
jgi:hypothetical protein